MTRPATSPVGSTDRLVGRSVDRLEDMPLLTGKGRFIDDIIRPEMLHAVMFRANVAHGRITRLDLGAARAMPGVVAVLGAADIAPHVATARMPLAMPAAAIRHVVEPEILARDEVTYVGQAIALVLAETRALAEDADLNATQSTDTDPQGKADNRVATQAFINGMKIFEQKYPKMFWNLSMRLH